MALLVYPSNSQHAWQQFRVQDRHPRRPCRHYLATLPATWLTTAAASPMLAREYCVRLTLINFLSVRRAPTSATGPLPGPSLLCSWTSSLELSADGPQTADRVTQPFHTVAEDVFIWE